MIVENCGYSGVAVQRILLEGTDSLAKARNDVGSPGMSRAFRAMFKLGIAQTSVRDLLVHIASLMPVPRLQPAPSALLRPRFACVESSSAKKYDYLNLEYDPAMRCTQPIAPSSFLPGSFYAEGTAYIFICPWFFLLERIPTSDICLEVENNKFVGRQPNLHEEYQVYSLLYSLIRFYLGKNALDGDSNPREVFDWNQCVFNLNEVESVINPTNLELYAAREYPNLSISYRAHCFNPQLQIEAVGHTPPLKHTLHRPQILTMQPI